MWIIKGIALTALIVILAYLLALTDIPLDFYSFTTQQDFDSGGLFFWYAAIAEFLMGLIVAYTFLVPLMFLALNIPKTYWWVGILLLPSVYFAYLDIQYVWFYALIALIGWGVGFGLQKLIQGVRR